MSELEDRADSALVNVDNAAIMETYPQLKEMPKKHAEIILLYAVGMKAKEIADHKGIARQSVYDVIGKYDVAKMIAQGMTLQKLMLASSLGIVMIHAMNQIRGKVGEMSKMGLRDIVSLLQKLVEIQTVLNPPELPKHSETPSALIDELKKAGDQRVQEAE